MKLSIVRAGLAMTLFAGAATAQGPGGPGGPGPDGPPMAGGRTAEQFLAHVGELGLSDAQVTRLAAIARRSEARRVAQRSAMDSMRARAMAAPADSAARAARRASLRATMERMRDQNQADLRDALAVLTPDQQAKAWQIRGAGARGPGMRGGAMRRGTRGMRGAGRGMRPGRAAGPRDGGRTPGPRPDAGPRQFRDGGRGTAPARPPVDSGR
jgi:Spy/CpxP family protein refolding chaperone